MRHVRLGLAACWAGLGWAGLCFLTWKRGKELANAPVLIVAACSTFPHPLHYVPGFSRIPLSHSLKLYHLPFYSPHRVSPSYPLSPPWKAGPHQAPPRPVKELGAGREGGLDQRLRVVRADCYGQEECCSCNGIESCVSARQLLRGDAHVGSALRLA